MDENKEKYLDEDNSEFMSVAIKAIDSLTSTQLAQVMGMMKAYIFIQEERKAS